MFQNPEITAAVSQVLTSICVAILTFLGAICVSLIGIAKQKLAASIESIKDENARKCLNNAVERVTSLVTTVVTSIEQEEKPEIVKALADGKIERDELLDLKQIAVERVRDNISEDIVDIIEETYSDFNDYVSELVSQSVYQLKHPTKED